MKAGSAGSNPDAITKRASATQPLRDFLIETGEAVAHLNTIVVGLDAVENGYQKPKGLSISWGPKDQKAAASKARRFAVEASLQKSSEALKEYIHSIASLQRLEDVRNTWTGKTTNSDKISDISEHLLGKDDFLHVGACLLVHWRNRIVHKRSNADLSAGQKELLTRNKLAIQAEFSGLDTTKLLDDFYKGRPTLKDVSTMITFSIRLVRKLDKELGDMTKQDLDQLLIQYGLLQRIEKVKRETSPTKVRDSIIRLIDTEVPGLAATFRKHY